MFLPLLTNTRPCPPSSGVLLQPRQRHPLTFERCLIKQTAAKCSGFGFTAWRWVGVGNERWALHHDDDSAAYSQCQNERPNQHHEADYPVEHQQTRSVFSAGIQIGRNEPSRRAKRQRYGSAPEQDGRQPSPHRPFEPRCASRETGQPIEPIHRRPLQTSVKRGLRHPIVGRASSGQQDRRCRCRCITSEGRWSC